MPTKDNSTKPDNLPCPFCGSSNIYIQNMNESDKLGADHFGPFYVECLDCTAKGPESIYQLTSLHNWNRRA